MVRFISFCLSLTVSVLAFSATEAQAARRPHHPHGPQLEPLVAGATVYTRSGSAATVNGVFGDGRVSVKVGYSNLTYSADEIASRGCWNRVCSDDTVYTRSGSTATVNGFFPSGDYSVKVGYSNLNYTDDQIAVAGCADNGAIRICSGDTVTTESGSSATVNGIFYSTREVSVKVGYSNLTYRLDQIASGSTSPPYGQCDGVRNGDTVYTRSGSTATVNGVFADCRVSVKIGYSNLTYDRADIAIRGSAFGLYSDETVVTSYGSSAVVNGFFQNGDVSVKVGYSNLIYHYTDLAH